jgi:LDH2 family malate/lactate/ureidoglycolate dehydrogenase
MSDEYFLIEKTKIEAFAEKCALKAGAKQPHARELALCLIDADYRGHPSHGVNRLG